MIKAGRMDRKIVFQRDTGSSESAIGSPVKNFTTLRTEWATVTPINGSEAFKVGRDVEERVSKFTVHYFSGLTGEDRISYDGVFWDILNIAEVGRRELLEVLARTHR